MRVLLEPRHAVVDVAGVRVHGRHANRGEVVGEVVLGVELGVLGAVAAPLLVLGAPGHETQQARAAAREATEDLDEQEHDLVVLATKGVVVVTWVKVYEAPARGVVVRLAGRAALAATEDNMPKACVWPTSWQPTPGLALVSGEATFDSPIQSVSQAEAPGWTRSGT